MNDQKLIYSRVVVKLSGESLRSPSGPLDPGKVGDAVKNLAALARQGAEVVVVIGGGNIGRGIDHSKMNMSHNDADTSGMLATAINAQQIAGQLRHSEGAEARIFGRGVCRAVDREYNRNELIETIERGAIAIIAGGMGVPGMSTDVAAVHQAAEIDAHAVLMSKFGTNGVYTADPNADPNAALLQCLTASYAIDHKLGVMDMAALGLAIQHRVLIRVFGADDNTAIGAVAYGSDIGSIILGE